jgi:uracil-DNA glycosylase family 4
MPFQDVLNFDENNPQVVSVAKSAKVSPSVQKKLGKRGCEFCPLNKVEGLHKIKNLDKVTGKKIMIWAQNPGESENRKRMELVGPAGKFLWDEGRRVGLRRDDCDIQNVVRCWTVDRNEFDQMTPREPAKQEIFCCSVYNEEAIALNNGKARVHLVLGKVASKVLLKGEFRKDQKTFWSERLKAWVVTTYHPSYFVRGARGSALKEFREALEVVVSKAGQSSGKFAFIEKQDYKSVKATELKSELETPIHEAAKAGFRIVVDIEDDVDEKTGENVVVYIGFSWKKGHSRGVFLNHPKVKQSAKVVKLKIACVKALLEDPLIKKAMQHGSYDKAKLRKLLDIQVRGYDHDTQYSEYLRFSGRRSFGLEAIADVRFREFAGYKEILEPYKGEDGRAHFLKVPPHIIVRYNGADCDLTKRIEKDNDGKVNPSLLKVLIHAASPLGRMESLGPWFDFEYDKVLQEWIPARLKLLRTRILKVVQNEKFNPNSPAQVAAVVYDKLHLDRHLDKEWIRDHKRRATDKDTLQLMGQFHKFPGIVTEYRKLEKKKSTYLDGYRLSAKLFGGRLRTIWWLTGTVTGRLKSGGGKDKTKGLVNLQNIHGSDQIENLLVSDLRWREVYKAWLKSQKED